MKTPTRVERSADFFRPRASRAAENAALLLNSDRFNRARALISAYYAVLLYFAVNNLYSWPGYLASSNLSPRWAVFWLRYVDTTTGISWILWIHLLGGLVGIALSGARWARIFVFVSLLEFLSFKYSFGSINHGDHLTILIAFVLIFLPSGWRSSLPGRHQRAATLLVFSGCQALIMLTYSMSGMWKIGGVVRQMVKGEVHALAPQGLAQQVAAKLLSVDFTSVLGPWLIDHYYVGWPLMIATLYLEIFALWSVFRPSTHRLWGLGLILFHTSSQLILGIGFSENCLWLALFFVLSPFRPRRLVWRRVLRDLPLLGRLLVLTLPGRAD